MISIDSARFGSIEVQDEDVLTFSEGLLGFAAARRFVRIPHGSGTPFVWLQSADRPELAFLLLPAAAAFPEFRPALPAGIASDAGIWVIVTVPGGKPKDMTANLLGPVVIEETSRRGWQIVLSDDRYTTRHRVFPATGSERRAPQPVAAGAVGG